jgi:murein DD-endopeptidase MepM/ murein hydrolase activator NlpD
MDIMEMSLTAAVLIGAVVIIRAAALYRLPKKTFLVLWGAVICRLLIPFSIPSRFSVYTGVDLLRQAAAQPAPAAAPAVFAGMPYAMAASGAANTENMGQAAGGGALALPVSPLVLIWLAGICVLAVFFAVSYFRYVREFKTALPVDNVIAEAWLREHPLRRPVRIRQSDRISAPLTYGIFSPVLLVPKATDWTDGAKVRYILTHEYVHIRRFDALMKLLLTAALCVHWFNPLVWVMYVLANRDIELTCDEAVVRTFGEAARSSYALTLIGLEEKKIRFAPLCNNFSRNATEERIKAIMKIKKYTLPVIIAAVVVVAGVIVGLATSKKADGGQTGAAANAAAITSSTPSPGNTPAQASAPSASAGPGGSSAAPASEAPVEPSPAATTEAPAVTDKEPAPEVSPAVQIVSEKGWIWPVTDSVTVTSKFGMRYHPIFMEYRFTDHIDIAAEEGMSVSAALDGTVSEAGFDSERGNYIVLDHDQDMQTVYSHLSETAVKAGDTVSAGDKIGTVGSTGNATGPFLAFGVSENGHSVNPMKYYKDVLPDDIGT